MKAVCWMSFWLACCSWPPWMGASCMVWAQIHRRPKSRREEGQHPGGRGTHLDWEFGHCRLPKMFSSLNYLLLINFLNKKKPRNFGKVHCRCSGRPSQHRWSGICSLLQQGQAWPPRKIPWNCKMRCQCLVVPKIIGKINTFLDKFVKLLWCESAKAFQFFWSLCIVIAVEYFETGVDQRRMNRPDVKSPTMSSLSK